MAPRLTKAQSELMEQFGFEFTAPPERTNTRASKYDDLWIAARTVAMAQPGTTLKVRVYNNPSAAYNDAKAINNSNHRQFKDDGQNWVAVAAKSDAENDVDEDGEPLFAVYLTYNPSE